MGQGRLGGCFVRIAKNHSAGQGGLTRMHEVQEIRGVVQIGKDARGCTKVWCRSRRVHMSVSGAQERLVGEGLQGCGTDQERCAELQHGSMRMCGDVQVPAWYESSGIGECCMGKGVLQP